MQAREGLREYDGAEGAGVAEKIGVAARASFPFCFVRIESLI
jgi:hypothetical protein